MTEVYAHNKKNWDKLWNRHGLPSSTNVSWSKKRMQAVLDPYLSPGISVLDAGCGSGFFSSYFCSRGMIVTALDYAEQALALTGRLTKGEATLICDDLLAEGLAQRLGSRFDLIFTDGLLEHFSQNDQVTILENLATVSNEAGIIATFVPNKWSPWQIIRPLYLPGIEEFPFTLKQLVQLNERAGLQVFRMGGLNTLPIRFSPDWLFGASLGMLFFTIAKRGSSN